MKKIALKINFHKLFKSNIYYYNILIEIKKYFSHKHSFIISTKILSQKIK